MKILGKEKTDQEILQIVKDFYHSVFNNKHSRYYQIRSLFPTGKEVLDFGCGWGIVSHYLASNNKCKVDAIDLSPDNIEICKFVWGNNPNIRFSQNEIKDIPSEKYDFLISSQVIEHTHNPGSYLSECNRVLKNGGDLLIGLPNVMNLRFLFSTLFTNSRKLQTLSENMLDRYDKTNDHIHAWDPLHFSMLLGSCGFVVSKYMALEGLALPKGKYWHAKPPFLKNLSYTMYFLAKKKKRVHIEQFA